ncbi:hypothetical protein AQUSIP_07320 [Aquicella siphonis]|uniref:Uncharacterized protein n=1 Tax=Aquicella siphonis TaxID=254247 RepID=A0A5E4PFY2_9COXI|nr:hypothetical protein [Aquicella siphonis]VVC75442.1 hypothetical protein AQUSIP_07320 [Aquicella siphonis]
MKGHLLKIALSLGAAASLCAAGAAQAGMCCYGGSQYYDTVTGVNVYVGSGMSYYGSYYNSACGNQCTMVPAHKYNGYYYPAQKVCYKGGYYNSTILCGWVKGYWKHKTKIPGHDVCWRY